MSKRDIFHQKVEAYLEKVLFAHFTPVQIDDIVNDVVGFHDDVFETYPDVTINGVRIVPDDLKYREGCWDLPRRQGKYRIFNNSNRDISIRIDGNPDILFNCKKAAYIELYRDTAL